MTLAIGELLLPLSYHSKGCWRQQESHEGAYTFVETQGILQHESTEHLLE